MHYILNLLTLTHNHDTVSPTGQSTEKKAKERSASEQRAQPDEPRAVEAWASADPKRELEAKRQANFDMYGRIYHFHWEKLEKFTRYFGLMETRFRDKVARINDLKARNSLNCEEICELEALLKKETELRAQIEKKSNTISKRKAMLERILELQKLSLTNPNPMEENPTIEDFHPSNFETLLRENEQARRQAVETERQRQLVEETNREKKRQQNAKTYHQIYQVQRDKVAQLKELVEEFTKRQVSKQSRIKAMEREKNHLRIEQKLHLHNLKKSLIRLEKKLIKTKNELSARNDLIRTLADLQKESLSNPDPMVENPCLQEFEDIVARRLETAHSTLHSTEAVPGDNLASPSPDSLVAKEKSADKHRSLMQRLKPKAMMHSLQKKLGKKPKNSRPLGAHHDRIRSRTNNMQEMIPQRREHYDSDSDKESPSPAPMGNPHSWNSHSSMTNSSSQQHCRGDRNPQPMNNGFSSVSYLTERANSVHAQQNSCGQNSHFNTCYTASQQGYCSPQITYTDFTTASPPRNRISYEDSSESVCSSRGEGSQNSLNDDWSNSILSDSETEAPCSSSRSAKPVDSNAKKCGQGPNDQAVKGRIQPKGRKIAQEAEEATELDRLIDAAEREIEAQQSKEGNATKIASEGEADVDRLLEATESELTNTSSSEPVKPSAEKDTNDASTSQTEIKFRIRPKGIKINVSDYVIIADVDKLLEADDVDLRARVSISKQCELILEVDLKNDPELIDWFVSPDKYPEYQGALIRRMLQLYKMGCVI